MAGWHYPPSASSLCYAICRTVYCSNTSDSSAYLSELSNSRADCFWINRTDKCQRCINRNAHAHTHTHTNISLHAHKQVCFFLSLSSYFSPVIITFLPPYFLTYKRIMSSFLCQLNSDVLLYTNWDSWKNLISHLMAPSPLTAGYILSKWVLCSLLFLIYYPQSAI